MWPSNPTSYEPKRHQVDFWGAGLVRRVPFKGQMDMPEMRCVRAIPMGLVSFREAIKPGCEKFDCFVDLYDDDWYVRQAWTDPEKLVPVRVFTAWTSRSRKKSALRGRPCLT